MHCLHHFKQPDEHDKPCRWHLIQPQAQPSVRAPIRAQAPRHRVSGGRHWDEVAGDEEQRSQDDVVPRIACGQRAAPLRGDPNSSHMIPLHHVAPQRRPAARVLFQPCRHEGVEAHHGIKRVNDAAHPTRADRRAIADEQHAPQRLAVLRYPSMLRPGRERTTTQHRFASSATRLESREAIHMRARCHASAHCSALWRGCQRPWRAGAEPGELHAANDQDEEPSQTQRRPVHKQEY
mmetsp:Transcript_7542/g.16881  ORF Transcript_7542/g.16881 Transcript_7542/m.16881 type:complete len:236 (-) Transcript_7542:240-947(-)